MSMLQHGLSEDSSYTVNQSLRFRASNSAYLSRTPSVTGNRQKFTLSAWTKRGALGSQQSIFYATNGATSNAAAYTGLYISSTDQITFIDYYGSNYGGAGVRCQKISSLLLRDISAHYHIQLSVDTTLATAEDRIVLYVNGVRITSWATNTLIPQNTNTMVDSSGTYHYIGTFLYGSYVYFLDSYLSEINFIDGQALDPSYFGQTDAATGIWVPKKYTGTYGTNGFYLPFNDATSLTTLGYDRSGNGNNWTCNGISITAGATYDVMKDSPTNGPNEVGNYATLNPLHAGRSTLTNGNLTASGTTDLPTIMPDSGTWYFEIDGVSKTWTPPAAFPAAAGNYNFGQRPFTNTATHPRLHTGNISDATPVTTSGTFTGNASTDGPCIFINGTPTAMTINSNAVTFATHADKLAGGFKVRSSSASYNASGTNTYSITTNSGKFKNARAQANP